MDPTEIPIRDLHLPPEVGWWPLAPGWWLLIAMGLVLLVAFAWRLHVAGKHNRARRHAMKELAQARAAYERDGDVVALAKRLSELQRRTMLAYAPRSEVAGLTGKAWLAWLERDLDEPLFTRGAGRDLLDLPYRNPATVGDDVDVDALIGAVRKRLRTRITEAA